MMKVRTHHLPVIVAALLCLPLFAAAWITFRYLGSWTDFRPWLLATTYYRLPADHWNLAWQIGLMGSLGFGALLLWAFEGMVFGVDSSDLHGSAEWAKGKAIGAAKLLQPWGVVLGRTGSARASKIMRTNAPDYSNIFLSAPPRSGKGVGVIIPTLLEYPGSFIVYDVKGENYDHTARRRLSMGDRVRVFSPFDLTLESGHEIKGRSHGFNPLIPIAENPDIEDRITEIDIMATSLLSISNTRDEGLLSSGREIFKAACAIVCDEEAPSLGKVVDLLSPEAPEPGETADLQTHFADLARRAPDPLSRQALLSASANKNENNALYMSVLFDAGLKAWRNPAVRRATETHDFDFDELRKFPYAIYIIVPTPYKETVAPVVRLFFQLALRTMQMRLPDRNAEPLDVLFAIDEFHSLGKMKEVLAAPTVLPGFGGRILTVVQTPASLEEIYGRDAARIFLDVTQLKIFMTPNDNLTKRMIEETVGYRTMVSKSISAKSLGTGDPRSHSFSEVRRPLMSADDIGKMPDDKEIIAVQGKSPVYADRIRYYSDPHFQPIHDAQLGLPWPTDSIPIVKDGIVTRMDDFLAMPGSHRTAAASSAVPALAPAHAHAPAPASAGASAATPPPASAGADASLDAARIVAEPGEVPGDIATIIAEPSDAERESDMKSRFTAAWTKCQGDFGVLGALDRDVSETQEDTPFNRILRNMTPDEITKRIMAVPDDVLRGRADVRGFATGGRAAG